MRIGLSLCSRRRATAGWRSRRRLCSLTYGHARDGVKTSGCSRHQVPSHRIRDHELGTEAPVVTIVELLALDLASRLIDHVQETGSPTCKRVNVIKPVPDRRQRAKTEKVRCAADFERASRPTALSAPIGTSEVSLVAAAVFDISQIFVNFRAVPIPAACV